ncbi:MAG: flagellar hook associated protein, partial [Phycisphaerae bacterium]
MAMDANGDFVVAWQSSLQDGSGEGIYARRYNAAGVSQSGEIPVNTTTLNNQETASVAMDADGDFVVTWQSPDQNGSGVGIFAR